MKSLVLVVILADVAHAQAPQREGSVMIAHTVGDRTATSHVDAAFHDGSRWGAIVATDGPCTLYGKSDAAGLSAGAIAISGTAQPITLEPTTGDRGIKYHTNPADQSFADGATITVSAAGGPDVPAFTASVTAPAPLTGFTSPTVLRRPGYDATWTAGTGGEIWIFVMAFQAKSGVVLICQVPDTGSFTIPASTFALIPPEYRRAGLAVSRVSKTEVIAGDTRVMVAATSSIVAAPIELSGVPHVAQPPTPAQPSPVQHSSVQPSACIPRETTPRGFLSISFGLGGLSRVGAAAPTGGATERLQFGQRLTHGLMAVEEWNTYGTGVISQAPVTLEDQLSLGAGIRWLPFERSSVPRSAART